MRIQTNRLFGALAAAGLAVTAVTITSGSVSADRPPEYSIDEEELAEQILELEDATGQEVLSGEIAGATWLAQVPENWNGDLIVWAHGYAGEGTTLGVGPPPALGFLLAEGFAWAASSFRRNSYDPGIGVIDTKNLTVHMQSMLRNEGLDTTYIAGGSMGGHVTAAAIESYPSLWDGALAICGVLGDVELYDYFLDYNLGAAAFAGVDADATFRSDDWLSVTAPEIKAALSVVPGGQWAGGFPQILGAPSPLTPAGETFKDFVEVGSGGDRVTFDAAWYYWHGLVSATGDFLFGLGTGDGTIANRSGTVGQNSDTSYADEYGYDIDDVIVRREAANRVRKSQGHKPAQLIDGTPSVPVLSLHTTGDLFVPIEMEQQYAAEVAANGLDHLLVQRAIRDVGHCSFTQQEIVTAYVDLFAWVEDGIVPAGEDLVADISSPSLGCEFTTGSGGSGLRGFLEPCP